MTVPQEIGKLEVLLFVFKTLTMLLPIHDLQVFNMHLVPVMMLLLIIM